MLKVLTATLLAGAALTLPATPASAVGSPGCVTRTEVRTVDIGQRRVHVHREFETRGLLQSKERNLIVRAYGMCNGRDTLRASYVCKQGGDDDRIRRDGDGNRCHGDGRIRWFLNAMWIR
jgi:hypothetical protein